MITWTDTGRKSTDQPTEEELRATAEEAKRKDLEVKKNNKGKKTSKHWATPPTRGSRSKSRRNIVNAVTTSHDAPKPDANGCCHEDINTWQLNCDASFYAIRWRKERQAKGREGELYDWHCFHCNGEVVCGTASE